MNVEALGERIAATQQQCHRITALITKLKGQLISYLHTATERRIDLDTADPRDLDDTFYWDVYVPYKQKQEQLESNQRKLIKMQERLDKLNSQRSLKHREDELISALPEALRQFCDSWCQYAIDYYIEHHDNSTQDSFRYRTDQYIRNTIESDARDKLIDIARRVQKRCGNITDASNLTIGDNGTINGKIIGAKGSANVETIRAGGYNIQCLHFRVLIK